MKKIFITALIILTTSAFAQQRSKGDIELTPKIGYGSSNYYGDDVLSENKSLSSFTFGVESDYFFNDRWSLHSGLLYQTMGSKLTSNYSEKLNYLTIPINANWHFGSTRKWYLNFGSSIGILMSADAEGEDIKDLANSTQFGINYGIGYKIFINDKISLSIDTQGMTGLSEVPKESDYTLKNSFGSINIGGVIKL